MFRALLNGFRNFADFRGRTARAEFWNFVVATHLVIMLLMLPAFVDFMKFWHFMLEDVRFLDVLAGVLVGDVGAEALEPIATELVTEYYSEGLPMLTVVGAVLSCVVALLVLVPTISMTMRRLRDAGQSPWWVLPPVLSMLPLPFVVSVAQMLSLVTLVFCCFSSRTELPEVPEGK